MEVASVELRCLAAATLAEAQIIPTDKLIFYLPLTQPQRRSLYRICRAHRFYLFFLPAKPQEAFLFTKKTLVRPDLVRARVLDSVRTELHAFGWAASKLKINFMVLSNDGAAHKKEDGALNSAQMDVIPLEKNQYEVFCTIRKLLLLVS